MHNPSTIKGTPLEYFCCILCAWNFLLT